MGKRNWINVVCGWMPALLVGVGLLLLGLCIKAGFNSISDNARVVSVRGLCERDVMANKVTWPIVSKQVGDDLPTIYQNVEATNGAILEFLKSHAGTDAEIAVNAPQVVDLQATATTIRRCLIAIM